MFDNDQFNDLWVLEESVTTTVEANGYSIWSFDPGDGEVYIELNEHLTDEEISNLCGQFTFEASYDGEGDTGSVFTISIYG